MSRSISRRQFVTLGLGSFVACSVIGCGTILHPERKGQPAGDLDWSIVALDGVGLLLFLVPGVIAFAFDFNNGTIYLPADDRAGTAAAASKGKKQRRLIPVATQSTHVTHGTVAHAISQHSGRQIRLVQGEYKSQALDDLSQFWDKRDQLTASSENA